MTKKTLDKARTDVIGWFRKRGNMKILTKKQYRSLCDYRYADGFRDAVLSLVRAIESGDKVVLGNGVSFVGLSESAPMTVVGDDTVIMNSLFTMDKKYKGKDPRSNITITKKL